MLRERTEYENEVRVAPAQFGRGVFALKRFTAGETIGRVDGEIIEDPTYESDYCMEMGDEIVIEPSAPFRYVNHSCQPNCELVEVHLTWEDDLPDEWELWLETLTDIEPGEQLTIDYGWTADVAIPCGCGSPNCRGWIVAEEEAHQVSKMHDVEALREGKVTEAE